MKFKVLYDGEKGILVNRSGQKKLIEGPRRVFLFLEKLEKLTDFVADETQYLVIKYLSGKVIHKQG